MSSRAVVRALCLREKGRAPAAFSRRRGRGLPSGRFLARSVTNSAVPPAAPCANCEMQILELRKEMMAETQRVWKTYDGLLDVNHSMLKKMCEIEAKAAERQIEAVEQMVKTSYRILGSGGAFMLGMFVVMSPLLKASWQQETIEAMEKKVRLQRVDTVIEVKSAEKGPTGATRSREKAGLVGEGTRQVDDGPITTDGSGKGNKGGKPASASPSAQEADGPTGADGSGKSNKGVESGSVSAQDTGSKK